MGYPEREEIRRTFRFAPPVRIRLPHSASQETVAVLATLIVAVLGEANGAEN